eukprot:5793074-Alexandrium_andersonii.AAC.1
MAVVPNRQHAALPWPNRFWRPPGIGRPSRARWAATPRRIAAQSARARSCPGRTVLARGEPACQQHAQAPPRVAARPLLIAALDPQAAEKLRRGARPPRGFLRQPASALR